MPSDNTVSQRNDHSLSGLLAHLATDITSGSPATEDNTAFTSLLKILFAHVSEAVVITTAELVHETEPSILYANPAFEQMTGYRLNEITGHSPRLFVGPATGRPAVERIRRALRERHAVHEELIIYRRSGEPFWIDLNIAPVCAPDGSCILFVAIHRDISTQKREKQELIELRERLALLLTHSPAVIFSSRATGDYGATYVSPNVITLMGYTPEQFTSDPCFWKEHIHPDDQAEVFALIARLSEEGHSEQEYRFRCADGSYRWTRAAVRLLRDADGQPQEIYGYWIDISDRKAIEAERLAMERRLWDAQHTEGLGIFAAGIAHDFNNLLTPILGYIELARSSFTTDEIALESLTNARQTVLRAADLAQTLLAYAGRKARRPEMVDLHRLIEESVQVLMPRAVFVNLRQAPEKLPPILADATQIRQIVHNLLLNAVEASPPSATVTITTALQQLGHEALNRLHFGQDLPPGNYVALTVADEGIGMDAATRARIFDPFFTTKANGHGLGLAVVQRIVRAHRGAIVVDSIPGQGTTITVWLPVLMSDAPATNGTIED